MATGAKADWLKLGDRNTKFFHACANQRRKANPIRKIKSKNGSLFESLEEIETAFVEFFLHFSWQTQLWMLSEACSSWIDV
jgi:hypothetical protein